MNSRKQDLIEKFVANTCTREELQQLLLMIQEENTQDISEMLKTNWEKTTTNNDQGIDWNAKFSEMMKEARYEDSVIAVKQNLFNVNSAGEKENLSRRNRSPKAKIYRIIIRTAVAASLVFAVMVGVRFLNNNNAGKQVTANKEDGIAGKADTMMVVMLHEENTTDKVKSINLPDGSQVNLFANSELTYKESAEKNRRDVVLKGKADFKVAKDKTRPFTVFSGDISTTALGTQFTVTAIPKAKEIRVRLYEGKVVVRSTKNNLKHRMKDVYLTPGLELVYDVNKETAIISSFAVQAKTIKKGIKNNEALNEDPEVPTYSKRSWIMFNNQSLDEIFKELGDVYNVKINYSKKDINKMYFIGTFAKSDSVEYILRQIANINNLSITKDGNTYMIKKNVVK
ncbi:MAG: Fe2+-dicitrate sensor, rane component [Chitinophagaceae bacterium]|nr:Fe2+-dicitrate sensor, rane component [Chitinophagaceae bacterium]MDB5221389.1 Fe2+-dicitrate sensor, rane component [Chitinophagaceae bacterium]